MGKEPIALSPQEGARLRFLAAQTEHESRVSLRARIVLRLAAGRTVSQVAREVRVSEPTVRLWRSRYVSRGIAGLVDAPRRGRPRQVSDNAGRVIVSMLAQTPPRRDGWSLRELSRVTGLPVTTLYRICREEKIHWSSQRPAGRPGRTTGS